MCTKGDFHIHTAYSDGLHTPKEIIDIAKSNSVDIIAITDHNNTDGIDEAINYGAQSSIKVIPGVELSTRYGNTRVHILGYFKDDRYKNEVLVEILRLVKEKRIGKIKEIFKSSYKFNWVGSKLPVEIGIEILRFFGATVVLAHPTLLPKRDFEDIIKLDFDGIEARYFLHHELDTENYIDVAKKMGIIYTAGSDFHGLRELYRIHGKIGSVFLNEKEIRIFLERLYKYVK